MIAETAVLSSPWQTDFSLKDDGLFDSVFDRSKFLASDDFGRITTEMSSVSSGNSVASSVCSEETPIDTELDDHLFASNNGYLNSSILGVFGEGSVAVEAMPSISLWDNDVLDNDLKLLDILTDEDYDVTPSIPSHPPVSHKRSLSESITEHKPATPWSKVCSREQISIVEDLTQIISTQMGLREQLEVIRIINPTAHVSPTDSEFVIDLNCLNDDKLHEIREYVRRHARCTSNSTTLSNNNCTDQSSCCSSVESSSECNSPPQKRVPTKKQRREERREARQRQRKEYRQMMKERRSGLFQKEEVLSLNSCDQDNADDDQDIDIL